MVSAMVSSPVISNPETKVDMDDSALNQAEFFLFLADSVEIGNTLTTPLDLENYTEIDSSNQDFIEQKSKEDQQ